MSHHKSSPKLSSQVKHCDLQPAQSRKNRQLFKYGGLIRASVISSFTYKFSCIVIMQVGPTVHQTNASLDQLSMLVRQTNGSLDQLFKDRQRYELVYYVLVSGDSLDQRNGSLDQLPMVLCQTNGSIDQQIFNESLTNDLLLILYQNNEAPSTRDTTIHIHINKNLQTLFRIRFKFTLLHLFLLENHSWKLKQRVVIQKPSKTCAFFQYPILKPIWER